MRFRNEIWKFCSEKFKKRRCLYVNMGGGVFWILQPKFSNCSRNGIRR